MVVEACLPCLCPVACALWPIPLPFPVSSELRMLDANLNRAREALRVMEDVARFVLSDADLAAAFKNARHAIRDIADAAGLDPLWLAASRDTPGDVGTSLTTAGETSRQTTADIAIAAGKRAGEALRVIEEAAKIAASPAASQAKSLRYTVYELEKRLTLSLGTGRARQWRLCVLITESLCNGRPWETIASAALAGGADCLQLREKDIPSGELLARARRLVALCREHHAACIINDRPDIAIQSGADGVHIGQQDVPVADIRRLAGTRLLVGVSTTNMAQARQAARDGADYTGCGPMFPTTTKHKPDLAGPAYLALYLDDPQTARIPSLAIGGITPSNIHELTAIGCRGVAVSSAVCSAPEPRSAASEIIAVLGHQPAPRFPLSSPRMC